MIWYRDVGNFMTWDNWQIIFPVSKMSLDDKLNAVLRLSIYIGLLIAIVTADYRWLFIPIVIALLSVLLTESDNNLRRKQEAFLEEQNLDIVDNQACVRSTKENPFMNPLFSDPPQRPAACSVLDPKVQTRINENFNSKLFRDVSDIYGNMSSQREFYTVPNTTVPNDSSGFAEWCYGSGTTCKEGNGGRCFNQIYKQYAHV